MTEHRVSVLSTTLRRYEDPTASRDPRIIDLLEALRTVEVAPPPRAHFRAELRTQLVAIAPRIVAEGMVDGAAMVDIVPRPTPAQLRAATRPAAGTRTRAATPQPVAPPATPARSPWAAVRGIHLGRPLAIAASVITVFAFLLGGAVYLSRSALPGDSLYGVKRASEQFELYTDTSDAARAQDHLDFAATRVDEARALARRSSASGVRLQAGTMSAQTSTLISGALTDADADTRAASRLLGDDAVDSASGKPLTPMVAWAPTQLARLQDLAAAIPTGALQTRAKAAWKLVKQAAQRANALKATVTCACMTKAGADQLGPIPCSNCGTQKPPRTTQPTDQRSGTPTAPAVTAPLPSGGTVAPRPVRVPGRPSLGGGSAGGTPTPTPTSTHPILPLPSLPLPTGKPIQPPIALGSCSIKVLVLSISLCPSATP